jgi:D-xylose 1-dehydrogenase (NADP+, D-xylono-1,5-lactone-forming)
VNPVDPRHHERAFRPATAPDVESSSWEPVRFGVIGASSMVARAAVVPAIEATPKAELVASASLSAGDDYAAVLADPAVEAVYIPLPNGMHREWVERCAEAGKHVLCEKPLALTADDARAMASACESAGVVLLEAYMTPYHPRSVALRDLVAAGRLGRLLSVRSVFTFPHEVPTDHRWDPLLGGGALADLGVYVLSPLFELAAAVGQDVPASVTSHAVVTEPDALGRCVDVTTVGEVRFPDGLTATFECSFDAPEAQVLEVTGTRGRVRVEHAFTPDASDVELVVQRRDGTTDLVGGLGGDCYRGMVDHFCAVVRGLAGSKRPPEVSVAFADLCDRLRASRG